MFTFILFIVLAIVFGIFATQNTQHVSITLANHSLSQIPLYIVLGVTLLIGLAVSWINGLLDGFSAMMKMRGKDHTIKDSKVTIQQLEKKLEKLEIENARLRDEMKNKPKNSEPFVALTDKIRDILPK